MIDKARDDTGTGTERGGWTTAGRLKNQTGAVLPMIAIGMIMLLAIAGLALDSSRGFIRQAQMARAVDAAVLTAARELRAGQSQARQQALAMASANGFTNATGGVNLNVAFGTNPEGEQTVTMTGTQPMSTILMRVLGIDQVTVAAAATAAVPPVDLTLVLDQSGSLGIMNAWDDLQDAAWSFVQNFDDNLDQVGLVSFQIRGTLRVPLRDNFTNPVRNAIYFSGMRSVGYTNPGEGLRLAYEQMTGPEIRDRSVKAVVFFTDGRPTAFRDQIGGQDRFMAVPWETRNRLIGYWNWPDFHPTDRYRSPSGCSNYSSCYGWTEPTARAKGLQDGLDQADAIRSLGTIIYSIGLGNPAASDPMQTPDMNYLQEIANVDGATDSSQPRGKAYFAPSANDLIAVFNAVAQDLLVRLAS